MIKLRVGRAQRIPLGVAVTNTGNQENLDETKMASPGNTNVSWLGNVISTPAKAKVVANVKRAGSPTSTTSGPTGCLNPMPSTTCSVSAALVIKRQTLDVSSSGAVMSLGLESPR